LRPLEGWPTEFTAERRRSNFDSSWRATMELLNRELRALGPYGLRSVGNTYYYPTSVLQLAIRDSAFRRDGMPNARAVPEHPGVILNIMPKGRPQLSFPCDTFDRWQDNLRGIALGLEALRKMDRYGITQTGQQYRGWQAIEARPSPIPQFTADTAEKYLQDLVRDAAGEVVSLNLCTIQQLYRRAVGVAHPDRNDGNRDVWNHVEAAANALRAAGRL
jgi:hypothetical protein